MSNETSEAVIQACYDRVKRDNPRWAEGVILENVAALCGTSTARVGETLREPPIRRYAIIMPAYKFGPRGE